MSENASIEPKYGIIPIDRITIVKNVRTNIGDVSGLISSIKKQGLLHPIGVYEQVDGSYVLRFGHRRLEACKKLGRERIPAMIIKKEFKGADKDFLLENFSENKNREETTPIEDGRIFSELGMSVSEIATETGIKEKYVKDAINAYKRTPDKYKKDIGINITDKFFRGKPLIDVNKANMITKTSTELNLSNAETEELFEWAKTHPAENLRRILTIISRATNTRGQNKMSIKEVLSKSLEIRPHTLFITVSQEEAERLIRQYRKSLSDILVNRLRSNNIPPLTDLVVGKKPKSDEEDADN